MSKHEDHCNESVKLFGKPYEAVHLWLDEFHGDGRYKMRHRSVRHHEAGIKEAIKLFGQEAGAVARQHIISDLKKEGWTDSDPFPRDETYYIKLGFF